jgi:hypothetical protein
MEHGLGLFSAQSIGVQEGVPWVGKEFGVGVAKDTCGHTVFSVLWICLAVNAFNLIWRWCLVILPLARHSKDDNE